jgi:hypothetical protein
MKGIIFSEFIELVEEQFGFAMVDDIIDKSMLASGGAYTAVGTYDHHEMLTMLEHLSQSTGVSVEDLQKVFGEHLLSRFVKGYPEFFKNVGTCFEFLDTIENRVHVQVKKLYPEAELPSFASHIESPQKMTMVYTSKRPFSALAYGLIQGASTYYGESIDIHMDDQSTPELTRVKFTLTKQ